MQPLVAVITSVLIIVAGISPAQIQRSSSDTQPGISTSGLLVYTDGELYYQAEGADHLQKLEAAEVIPYKVVTSGQPVLVTTCGANLEPVTYVVNGKGEIQSYSEWVPLIVQPPLTALLRMPARSIEPGLGVILLDTDGSEFYRNEFAEMLYPANTPVDMEYVYVVETAGDGDSLLPLGYEPRLTAVSLVDGDAQWETPLTDDIPLADAQLWALSEEWLLVSIQYNYEHYELLVIHQADGRIHASWPLNGIPGGAVVYPGPVWEAALPEVDGSLISVVVFVDEARSWQRWEIDCVACTLKQENCTAPTVVREDNTMDIGGAGVPGPGSAPFPQRLLPDEWGANWEIDALTDGMGRVLVVDVTGARWIEPETGG